MQFIPWTTERKEREFQLQILSVVHIKSFPLSLVTTTACTQVTFHEICIDSISPSGRYKYFIYSSGKLQIVKLLTIAFSYCATSP